MKTRNFSYKKWALSFICLFIIILMLLGSVTVIIDPFFHYHAPLKGLQYRIYYERYQNDGILKHFDYDAVITGNSMSENFKSSELDALFGVNSVKVPYSGASAKELDLSNRTAIKANKNIKLIVMDIDLATIISDKDTMAYDESDYPSFLYDSNPLNDVKYLFNKSIFKTSLDTISYTLAGNKTTSFDDYSFWDNDTVLYGRDAILQTYFRPYSTGESYAFTEEQRELVRGNVGQNIIETASANPQIDFYVFFSPVSMYFWDKYNQLGTLEMLLAAEREAVEMMLEYDNIHVFSFLDEYELVQDFDRYKDYVHYDSDVNSHILECMAAGEHQLTRENYDERLNEEYEFYTDYDYDSLFN